MCFDAKGRLFVCEMRGYPNGGGHRRGNSRQDQVLEDKDGDGFFETVTSSPTALRFPIGITPYKDGMIVATRRTSFTSKTPTATARRTRRSLHRLRPRQHPADAEQPAMGPRQLDLGHGRRHGRHDHLPEEAGHEAGQPPRQRLPLRPGMPGSLEPTSGGGQYGWPDAAGRGSPRRTATTAADRAARGYYLAETRYLPPAVTADIDVEGTAARSSAIALRSLASGTTNDGAKATTIRSAPDGTRARRLHHVVVQPIIYTRTCSRRSTTATTSSATRRTT